MTIVFYSTFLLPLLSPDLPLSTPFFVQNFRFSHSPPPPGRDGPAARQGWQSRVLQRDVMTTMCATVQRPRRNGYLVPDNTMTQQQFSGLAGDCAMAHPWGCTTCRLNQGARARQREIVAGPSCSGEKGILRAGLRPLMARMRKGRAVIPRDSATVRWHGSAISAQHVAIVASPPKA